MASTRPENGAERHDAAAETDRVLLTRFVRDGDEDAFTEIVRRHSGLVFGVCHRTLRDRQAAEDAFQATFLVLARSAGRIRRRTSLGSWLHGVACRVSLRALAKRHRRRETCSPMNTIATEPTLQDVGEMYEQQLLDAELRELPEKYREPLVLHYLQGLNNQQVAERLDVSVPCVEGRLKRGRKELRLRLTRRGLGLGAALTAVHLTSAAARAGALESLITSTTQIAAAQSLPSTTAAVVPSEAAAQLAAKEIAMLAATKTSILISSVAVAVLAVGIVAGVNSSALDARAGSPQGVFPGTQLETTLDAAVESSLDTPHLAQAGAQPGAPGAFADDTHQGTEDLERRVQDLRDQLHVLQLEIEARESNASILTQDPYGAMGAGTPPGAPGSTPAQDQTFDFSESDPQTQRIRAALDAQIDIEFPSNPLRDVLDYITITHDVPILFDESRATEAGISPDEEISLVLTDVTLANALEIMLDNISGVELDYIVENQVLKITTREHAESVMETRVYSLNQLPAEYNPEDIARVIIRSIAPESWRNSVVPSPGYEEYGGMMSGMMGAGGYDMGGMMGMSGMESLEPIGGPGQGSVEPLPGVLVVTQSQRVHREIVDLLSQLKRQYEVTGRAAGAAGGFGMEDMYDDVGGYPGTGGVGAGGYPGGAFNDAGADFEEFGFDDSADAAAGEDDESLGADDR